MAKPQAYLALLRPQQTVAPKILNISATQSHAILRLDELDEASSDPPARPSGSAPGMGERGRHPTLRVHLVRASTRRHTAG